VLRVFERVDVRPVVQTGASYLSVIGKLGLGQSLARAEAELKTMDARYKAQFGSFVDATRFQLPATSLDESLVGFAARAPFGCLVRPADRVRQRGRLTPQFLTESRGCPLFAGAARHPRGSSRVALPIANAARQVAPVGSHRHWNRAFSTHGKSMPA
jgi:hypothetical protein